MGSITSVTVRRRARASGVGLAALIAALAIPLSATVQSRPEEGSLFATQFVLDGEEGPDAWCLYVQRPGRQFRRVLGGGCPDTPLVVSPNGRWVVYAPRTEPAIVIRALRGTPPRMRSERVISLAPYGTYPRGQEFRYGWSADSRRVVVMHASDVETSVLTIVRRDVSEVRRLDCRCPSGLSNLAWSRRGFIAYSDAHRLYAIPRIGDNARKLAGGDACDYSPATPAVSRDGRSVLFACGERIVSVRVRSGVRRPLFSGRRLPRTCDEGPARVDALAWGPASRSIVLAEHCALFGLRADGSRPRRIPDAKSLTNASELRWVSARSR